jgi:predicted TPR repeat methyltransferase
VSRLHPACTAEAFDRRYVPSPDPWQFANSAYELNRYRVLLKSLTRTRYSRAFEPGCSIGVFTAKLAGRCDFVLATDVSPRALDLAKQRCGNYVNVAFEQSDLADDVPGGPFDLIVLSEIGYYFSPQLLERVAAALSTTLAPGGELIAAHRLDDSADHVLHGDAVHATLLRALPLRHATSARHPGFRLDGWLRDE